MMMTALESCKLERIEGSVTGGIREGDFSVWLERHQPTETKGKDQKWVCD